MKKWSLELGVAAAAAVAECAFFRIYRTPFGVAAAAMKNESENFEKTMAVGDLNSFPNHA